MNRSDVRNDPVVITGIGLVTPLGGDRETTWQNVRKGNSGLKHIELEGVGQVVGGPAPMAREDSPEWLLGLTMQACEEAIDDALLDFSIEDRDRAGCVVSISGFVNELIINTIRGNLPETASYWDAAQPNFAASQINAKYNLCGPALSPAAACATGLISVLRAVECIEDGYCDVMLAGCSDASLDRFTVSGFRNMRVLAKSDGNPEEAVRPFDAARGGFAIGEGSAVFVLESMSHALKRNADIYAVVAGGMMGGEGYHVTSLNPDPSGLAWLIRRSLQRADIPMEKVDYINAHGTGTLQNDLAEARAIQMAFGDMADSVQISATKSMIGHLLTAAGGVELAVTALAVRDGYIPPTMNLTHPDPEIGLNCTPLHGVPRAINTALKLSIAFGGHFGAAILRHPSVYGIGKNIRTAA